MTIFDQMLSRYDLSRQANEVLRQIQLEQSRTRKHQNAEKLAELKAEYQELSHIRTTQQNRNAIHEVMQEITLAGLYRGGFFDKAAFYGGTCLRIFHGLPRFSEDLDFSLVAKNLEFDLKSYFPSVIEEFKAAGREVVITPKEKKTRSNPHS